MLLYTSDDTRISDAARRPTLSRNEAAPGELDKGVAVVNSPVNKTQLKAMPVSMQALLIKVSADINSCGSDLAI